MYMKSLIGRAIGSIVSMQPHVAQAARINGTHEIATVEEIAAANLPPEDLPAAVQPEAFPEGYSAQPIAGGGFELIGPDGAAADDQIYPNLPAARGAAAVYAAQAAASVDPVKTTDPTEEVKVEETQTEQPAEEAATEEAAAGTEENAAPTPSRRRR